MVLLKSLKFKIILTFVLVLAPLILFLLYLNQYGINTIRNQNAVSNKNFLSIYSKQIDNSLEQTNKYINRVLLQDPDISSFAVYLPDSLDYALSVQRISSKLYNNINYYEFIDTLFVYNRENKKLIIVSRNSKDENEKQIREDFDKTLSEINENTMNQWNVLKVGNEYKLGKVISSRTGLYIGTWIDMDSLIKPLNLFINYENKQIVILSDEGLPLTRTETALDRISVNEESLASTGDNYKLVKDPANNQKYILVDKRLNAANVHLTAIIPEKDMLRNMFFFQRSLYACLIIAGFLLCVYLFSIQKILFKPIKDLIAGMRKISKGDMDVRIKVSKTTELNFLVDSFNKMVKEIHNLKIDAYEESLKAKENELKRLQMQINPHFYLNSLNIVYNLAVLKDYNSIKKMALHLANYFRFTMNSHRKYVTISEELQHIENYMEIQKLRFPDQLNFFTDIPEEYLTYQIYPLTLQPFIENAIIHGFKDRSGNFAISIRINKVEQQTKSFVKICIADNGVGFESSVLSILSSGGDAGNMSSQHVGIWNVINRLKLRYNGEAKVTFENGEGGGAVVSLFLPDNNLRKGDADV